MSRRTLARVMLIERLLLGQMRLGKTSAWEALVDRDWVVLDPMTHVLPVLVDACVGRAVSDQQSAPTLASGSRFSRPGESLLNEGLSLPHGGKPLEDSTRHP